MSEVAFSVSEKNAVWALTAILNRISHINRFMKTPTFENSNAIVKANLREEYASLTEVADKLEQLLLQVR